MEKVNLLFSNMVSVIDDCIICKLPASVKPDIVQGKISKGEQYQQLPYIILDHPRIFAKDDILAVRTMFWWAKMFSVTVHLSGRYLDLYRDVLMENYANLKNAFSVCINDDQWQHHFGSDNYIPVAELSFDSWKKLIGQNSFLKVAVKYDLSQWEQMGSLLKSAYEKAGEILSFQGGEKDL
jgi:hypothetical protein